MSPDPFPEERDAIAAALSSLAPDERRVRARSAWWRAGVRENVGPGDGDLDRTAGEPAP